jgi:Kef-type K+ transport system membrane component KefB/nucleotide-binding universal stress UspA family protein
LTEPFMAASHNDVLQVLISLALLLAVARLLGEFAQRLGQPSVVGEILAGVILGPSILGTFAPDVARWVIPQTAVQGYLVEIVALLGVMLLLVVTGFEIDLGLIKRKGRTAVGVAVVSIPVSFTSGLILGLLFPADLLVDPTRRIVFALFLATAMSIAAIPVLAKVLIELRIMRRNIGQTILAAAMIEDLVGWSLLGIVVGLADTGRVTPADIGRTIGVVVLFVLATAVVGRLLVAGGLAFVQNRLRSRDRVLTLVIAMALAWGAFTQWLGLEPVLGAFAVGILFGRMRRLPQDAIHKLETIALSVFTPIFFAVAGLKVDVSALGQPRLLVLGLVVIGVASAGKVIGAFIGARYVSKQDRLTSLAFGVGLNARGAVEIIVASVGLSLGILSQEVFSMIIVMAVVTSLAAPFALRAIVRRIEPDADETVRLRRAETAEGSVVGSIKRVLLPIRPRANPLGGAQVIEATLLRRLASSQSLAITLMSVGARGERAQVTEFLNTITPMFGGDTVVTRRIVESKSPVEAVLAEAERDYDLVVLGATEMDSTSEALFGGVVDEIVRLAPVVSLVVRGSSIDPQWRPRRIVLPTDGTTASRRAAELVFSIAEPDSLVTVVHVVARETGILNYAPAADDQATRLEIGHQIAADLRQLGDSFGVATETEVRMGPEPEEAILDTARRINADLVVLGTSVRPASQRLFLGPRVERVLASCPCPVVVFNT